MSDLVTLTFNFWDSVNETGNAAVGHTSLCVKDVYINWWPLKRISDWRCLSESSKVNPTLQDDIKEEGREPTEVVELNITEEQADAIITWWKELQEGEAKYHLLWFNCSTVIFKALLQAFPGLKTCRREPGGAGFCTTTTYNYFNGNALIVQAEVNLNRIGLYDTSANGGGYMVPVTELHRDTTYDIRKP